MYVYKISLKYKRTLHDQEQNKLSKNYKIPDGSCSLFFWYSARGEGIAFTSQPFLNGSCSLI